MNGVSWIKRAQQAYCRKKKPINSTDSQIIVKKMVKIYKAIVTV